MDITNNAGTSIISIVQNILKWTGIGVSAAILLNMIINSDKIKNVLSNIGESIHFLHMNGKTRLILLLIQAIQPLLAKAGIDANLLSLVEGSSKSIDTLLDIGDTLYLTSHSGR